MINIRKGLYETNSSSVHALVIPKENTLWFTNIYKSLYVVTFYNNIYISSYII